MAFLAVLAAWVCGVQAQVPQKLNYQGNLTDAGGTPIQGGVVMTFRLYNSASGGSPRYTETQLSVNVINGRFDAVIGSKTPLTLPFDVPYWLSVAINADGEMAPRQQVTASPYSLNAAVAEALAPSAVVGTAQIADNAVTQAKLSPLTAAAAGKVLGTDGST